MSAEAIGYVFRHSEARGITRLIHLALADITNDTHENRLWAGIGTVARKAGVSPSTAQAHVHKLVELGYLQRLSPPGNPGRSQSIEYRFILPEFRSDASPPPGEAPQEALPNPGEAASPPPGEARTTQELTQRTNPTPPGDLTVAFDEFWAIYPRRQAKDEARKAFAKRVRGTRRGTRHIPPTPAADIIAGARRFAADPNLPPPSEAQYIPAPTTWLNQGRWADDPLPPRGSARGRSPHNDIDEEAILAHLASKGFDE